MIWSFNVLIDINFSNIIKTLDLTLWKDNLFIEWEYDPSLRCRVLLGRIWKDIQCMLMTPHEQKWFATSIKLTLKSSRLGNVIRAHNTINGIAKRCSFLVLTSESRVNVGAIQSPILGQRPFPEPNLNPKQIQSAFHSEDSEILVHNTSVRDRNKNISPKLFGKDSAECENQSTYTWSVTDQAQGNLLGIR